MKPTEQIQKKRAMSLNAIIGKGYLSKKRVTVGMATCEIAAGSQEVMEVFEAAMKEGLADVHLSQKGCVGRCNLEPTVEVIEEGRIPVKYGKVNAERARAIIERHIKNDEVIPEWTLERLEDGAAVLGSEKKFDIAFCDGPACIHGSSKELMKILTEECGKAGVDGQIRTHLSGCLGMCGIGPVMIVNPGYFIYGHLTPESIREIVAKHLVKGKAVAEHLVDEEKLSNRFMRIFGDLGFFGKQMRITLRNCGVIDPESIDDYLALRGYEALARVLESMSSEEVVEAVKRSGLRGRGGAGFPTGMKWDITARAGGTTKYVICNADEGDPGAFMDRSAIEGDPHTVIEGMLIGGYAVGASKG
ncbi:MAG: NAD(P)H-dependent oxidoreductase subunit E, partial [Candidatus Omnitrophica bacterium]|nr:NAD(P)H-dependent oxidoreductase subunit E [Candidatus Omnitrophota bacterium]